MTPKLLRLSFAALLALGLSTHGMLAQEAATEEPAAEAEAEAEGEATGNLDLPLGEPVGPQPGQPFVRETIGDWQIRCVIAAEDQPEVCQMYQLLSDNEGNPVSEFTLLPVPNEGQAVAGATVITPLETLLTEQMRWSIDGGPAKRYQFQWCNRLGCFARMGLLGVEVDAMKRGSQGQVSISALAAPGQPINLNVSLNGFTAAYDKLREELDARQSAAE